MITCPQWSNRRLATDLAHSEAWVRVWRRRFDQTPSPSLEMFQARSRAPKTHPNTIAPEVKDAVGDLRQALSIHYHRRAGPILIREGLKKHLDLAPFRLPTSTRTLTKILHELGSILPRRRATHHPLSLCAPMEEWEMDFCQVFVPEEGVFEIFLVVDAGTSRVVYVESRMGYNAESALDAVARLFVAFGLPQRLRLDRDPRFVGSWTRDGHPAPLLRFIRSVGVEPVVCPPRRPDLKPHVERCVGTLKHEWLARFPWETRADLHEIVSDFPHYHNAERLHQGRACANRTPDEAFPVLPRLPDLPDQVNTHHWMSAEHERVYQRRVNSSGMIQIDQHRYYIDHKLAKQGVLLQMDAEKRVFHVTHEGKTVKELPIRGLLPETMDFQAYLRVMKEEAGQIARYRQMQWEKVGDPPF